jgi:hypothetical protein
MTHTRSPAFCGLSSAPAWLPGSKMHLANPSFAQHLKAQLQSPTKLGLMNCLALAGSRRVSHVKLMRAQRRLWFLMWHFCRSWGAQDCVQHALYLNLSFFVHALHMNIYGVEAKPAHQPPIHRTHQQGLCEA